MNSQIYKCQMHHHRFAKTKHSFSYPLVYSAFDLDELHSLASSTKFFSYNALNLVCLKQQDYLCGKTTSLKLKLIQLLNSQNLATDPIEKIYLVTMPRFCGYAFNPVSFYFCYDSEKKLHAFIAEVNNTFGERHFYITNDLQQKGDFWQVETKKCFHVSPFFDRSGDYEFYFQDILKTLNIQIRLKKNNKTAFFASLEGKSQAFNQKNLFKIYLQLPFATFLTIPRILWQALKLSLQKRLKVYKKPPLQSNLSIKYKKDSFTQRLCKRILFRHFQKIQTGQLLITLPDQSQHIFGNPNSRDSIDLTINDSHFFSKSVFGSDIGFAESYILGQWQTSDLTKLLRLFVKNTDTLQTTNAFLTALNRLKNTWQHRLKQNTLKQSQKNIQAHYDLSNDFYQTFLDESLVYSCAYFQNPGQDLKSAQKNKIQMMIEKAEIAPHHHVLEIGSGWGALAIAIAKQKNCKVTSITLSKEQLHYAKDLAQKHGVADKVNFELCDYRNKLGQFDRIVSVEMIEAVGHEHHKSFFQNLDRLLKPNGKIVLQAITIPDHKYDTYRKSCDFIQKHIFPGGLLPSVTRLSQVMSQNTAFFIDHLENFGIHYAETLKIWRKDFLSQKQKILDLGFDQNFINKWDYYLSYCEAGFRERILNTVQIVLTRSQNQDLLDPFTSQQTFPTFNKEIA